MLPFFAKLSEKIKEKVYGLLVGPRPRETIRKRTIEMDTLNRGPEAKKMKMNKEAEERDADGDARNCFNNNHRDKSASASEEVEGEVGGDARNPSSSREKAKTESEGVSPLKALLRIKKEHGGSGVRRPRARNPYSVRKIHNLGHGSHRVVNWTEDQIEIMTTALTSFRYSPRTTTDRVFIELRVSQRGVRGFNRDDVRKWLSERCDYDCSQRLLSRKRKIEEIGEIEVTFGETKRTRKVRFSEEIQQKYFSIFENPSAVEENHHVVYVPLNE